MVVDIDRKSDSSHRDQQYEKSASGEYNIEGSFKSLIDPASGGSDLTVFKSFTHAAAKQIKRTLVKVENRIRGNSLFIFLK